MLGSRSPALTARGPLPVPRSSLLAAPPVAAALAVLLGAGVGVAVAAGEPAAALAATLGVIVAASVAASLRLGLLALVAVASLLPFAVIPISFGVQLTVVDALLGAILLGWAVRVVATSSRRTGEVASSLPMPARLLLLYLGVALAALLAGAAHAPLTGAVARAFLKYVAAILLMLAVLNVARDRDLIRTLIRALIVCGALAATVGLLIHALPRPTIVDLLSSLSVVGYPAGPSVLRFLPGPNNTYSDTLRATGTSIDPNVFGGLLMLAAALLLGQWLASRPVVPRWSILPLAAPTLAALALSQSRGAWLGLAAAGLFLALFRERRIGLLLFPAAVALLALPIGREMLERLLSGLAFRDRAAALRLDEYRQALQLITAYPVLGVGFGAAPELGTFVGVSSIYLLVGEQTGLLGLSLFLATLAALALASLRALRSASGADRDLVVTLQVPLVAALTAGLGDHYFMNPRFPHMVALFWLYAGLLVAATRLATSAPSPRS